MNNLDSNFPVWKKTIKGFKLAKKKSSSGTRAIPMLETPRLFLFYVHNNTAEI